MHKMYFIMYVSDIVAAICILLIVGETASKSTQR